MLSLARLQRRLQAYALNSAGGWKGWPRGRAAVAGSLREWRLTKQLPRRAASWGQCFLSRPLGVAPAPSVASTAMWGGGYSGGRPPCGATGLCHAEPISFFVPYLLHPTLTF